MRLMFNILTHSHHQSVLRDFVARSAMITSRKYSFDAKKLVFKYVNNKFRKSVKLKLGSVVFGTCAFGVYFATRSMPESFSKVYCEKRADDLDDMTENVSLKTKYTLKGAIKKAKDLVHRVKDEVGCPGIVVGVSVDGRTVLETGMGFSDIENRTQCSKNTVMRIASISKSLTMAAIGRLWQEGKLDMDKPVQDYVAYFPEKTFKNEKVLLTCRHLVSHLGGIRHYDKNAFKKVEEKEKSETLENKNNQEKTTGKTSAKESKKTKAEETEDEFSLKEYYLKEKFDSVKTSLDLFKDDPLVYKPGTKYLYTTHGWTLLSAVVETVAKEPFPVHMTKLFQELGMTSTRLDLNDIIIYHRSRNYLKDKKGYIVNAPYVDNSYKWAGGGFLSTVGDLLRFGNIMLYSLQYRPNLSPEVKSNESVKSIKTNNPAKVENNPSILKVKSDNPTTSKETKSEDKKQLVAVTNKEAEPEKSFLDARSQLPGFLKNETVEMLWSPITTTEHNGHYGMGWVVSPQKQDCAYCKEQKYYVTHSGGAIGTSSVLLILPKKCPNGETKTCIWSHPPKGVVVTLMTNLQGVSLTKTALEIGNIFEQVEL